jgi:hypothetical protein
MSFSPEITTYHKYLQDGETQPKPVVQGTLREKQKASWWIPGGFFGYWCAQQDSNL